MSGLKATLFGKFNIKQSILDLKGMGARKVQELLRYQQIDKNPPNLNNLRHKKDAKKTRRIYSVPIIICIIYGRILDFSENTEIPLQVIKLGP